MPLIRLDKLLADMGEGTRSEVKKLIKNGGVQVDGKVARDGAFKVDPQVSSISVDGRKLSYSRFTYLMLNKPSGVISATEDNSQKVVTDLLKPPYSKMGLFPVGRLDKDTTGLLILTNDGDFAHSSLSPRRHVPKTYYVEAKGNFSSDIAIHFNEGIVIDGGYKCKSALLDTIRHDGDGIAARLTITEGKFHQIKRMFKAEGGEVTLLKRIGFGNIKLDENLAEGESRLLTGDELKYISELKEKR